MDEEEAPAPATPLQRWWRQWSATVLVAVAFFVVLTLLLVLNLLQLYDLDNGVGASPS